MWRGERRGREMEGEGEMYRGKGGRNKGLGEGAMG